MHQTRYRCKPKPTTDMQKQITLTIEQAREMLGKDIAMDQLIRANFSDEELNPKPKYPKRWKDLETIEGYYVHDLCVVCELAGTAMDTNYNVFATEQQARSFGLIYPQLTQLMKAYRGGWEPDWTDDTEKFCVVETNGELGINVQLTSKRPISFHTEAIAQQFLTDHCELILEFYKGM